MAVRQLTERLTAWRIGDPDGRFPIAKSRMFGADWIDAVRSAILIVPSMVSREESNIVINPAHTDAARIRPGREQPVRWDHRLFDRAGR
jgi:RES domain-containing protein